MIGLKAGKDVSADAIRQNVEPSLAALMAEVGLGISQAATVRRQLDSGMDALIGALQREIHLQEVQQTAALPKRPS